MSAVLDYIKVVEENRVRPKCKPTPPGTSGHGDTRRVAIPVIANELPCIHLGPAMRDQKCGCKKKLRKCNLFDTCTTGAKVEGVQCCKGCDEFRTSDSHDDARRHLIYFIYPIAGNGVWQKNVDELKKRVGLFNGRRVVAICNYSPRKSHVLDSPVDVIKYLGNDFETMQVSQKQAGKLGEVTAFSHLLNSVRSYTSPYDYTFYAHAKGVVSSQRHRGTLLWGEMMYGANLDKWSEVEKQLQTSTFTGAFRRPGGLFPWHYAGTFYWFKNKDIFSRNWNNIPQRYGGTEMWPSGVAAYEESSCLFGDNNYRGIVALYNGESHVYDEYKQWHGQS